MYLTIIRRDRDALYDGVMTDLTAVGDGKSTIQLRIVLLTVQVLGMDIELRRRG